VVVSAVFKEIFCVIHKDYGLSVSVWLRIIGFVLPTANRKSVSGSLFMRRILLEELLYLAHMQLVFISG